MLLNDKTTFQFIEQMKTIPHLNVGSGGQARASEAEVDDFASVSDSVVPEGCCELGVRQRPTEGYRGR